MDIGQAIAIRRANSMKLFAGDDETFIFGDWRDWESACTDEGKTIPPSEFKAMREKIRNSMKEKL